MDLVLFVNGVPTATAELKNRADRDPKNLLFAKRAFVHFAIDAELAYMTTSGTWSPSARPTRACTARATTT
jgi:type I restriction enzyme R subunit